MRFSKMKLDALLNIKLINCVEQDTNLWAHRLVLGSVSPFLRSLLIDFERRGDDVITIFLPLIKVPSRKSDWKHVPPLSRVTT